MKGVCAATVAIGALLCAGAAETNVPLPPHEHPRLCLRAAPLYAAVSAVPARREAVTLIPYFAWNNRGEPQMCVWLPLAN